jgi:hypothetical protein
MSLLSEFDVLSIRLREALKEAGQSTTPDAFSSVELQSNDLMRFVEEVKSLKQDRTERKGYASKLYFLVLIWLGVILFLVFMQGAGFIPFSSLSFNLSDTVIITLISSTTANIAAFLLIVVRYLFPVTRPKCQDFGVGKDSK